MKIKNCQKCHDLKVLKKELAQSYANFKQFASNASEREKNLTERIDDLEREIERLEDRLYGKEYTERYG